MRMLSLDHLSCNFKIACLFACTSTLLTGCGKTEVAEQVPTRFEQSKQIEVFLRGVLAENDSNADSSLAELEAQWRTWFTEARYGQDAARYSTAPPLLASMPSAADDTTTPFFLTDVSELISSRGIIKSDRLLAFGVVDEDFAKDLAVNWSSSINLTMEDVIEQWCELHGDKELIPSLELILIFSKRAAVKSEISFYPGVQ
jgi:hypothetical protein